MGLILVLVRTFFCASKLKAPTPFSDTTHRKQGGVNCQIERLVLNHVAKRSKCELIDKSGRHVEQRHLNTGTHA